MRMISVESLCQRDAAALDAHVGAWIKQEFARSGRDLEWEATRHDQMARWLLCKEVFDLDLCLVHAHFRIS
jgi:hypothetical protein